MSDVRCFECKGTGSSVPDCYLCEGYRSVKAKRAYALGWKKTDLIDLQEDGFAECPSCYDEARSCIFCYGDGKVDSFINEQQRNRVLIAAAHNRSDPPVCFRFERNTSRLEVDPQINLLSGAHARELKREQMITWYCSVFGDEIYLTPQGENAARAAWKEYRSLRRKWVLDERERRTERLIASIIIAKPRIVEEAF